VWAAKEDKTMCDDNLVLLNKKKNEKKDLFFIHDFSGEVESYVDFCNRLKTGFNCWGVKADRFNGISPRDLSFVKIAGNYIAKIKKVQEHGPYYISGWSLGGSIAFEMVRQLEKTDEKVELLALIDSPPPDKSLIEFVRDFSLENELAWIGQFLQDSEIIEKLRKIADIEKFWESVVTYLLDKDFNRETIRSVLPPHMVQLIPNYKGLETRDIIYYVNVIRSFSNAGNLYKPEKKIKAQTYYFEASRSKHIRKNSWSFYCSKPIKCYRVIGDHFSIFNPPHSVEFAGIFEKVIHNEFNEIDNDRFLLLKSSIALRLVETFARMRRKMMIKAQEKRRKN
jgi:thioesterase domain-containing protein